MTAKDEKFEKYINSYIRWDKFWIDASCCYASALVASFISEHYPFPCKITKSELWKKLSETAEDWTYYPFDMKDICLLKTTIIFTVLLLFTLLIIRILFSQKHNEKAFSSEWARLKRTDGKSWTFLNALSYGIIEWLPVFLGLIYFFLFGFPDTLFDMNASFTVILGTQLIWLAPVIFRFKGRNLSEIVGQAYLEPTETGYEEIEKIYDKKFVRAFKAFPRGLGYSLYVICTGALIFSFVQILRIPPLHPEYEKTLYSGYNPV